MSKLRVKIQNLRGVKFFDFTFPISNGVHTICGVNGVGKSTIMSALSKVVYPTALNSYFRADGDHTTSVYYEYDGVFNEWIKNNYGSWSLTKESSSKKISFDGLFESSFIYGNRFSDAHKSKLGKIYRISDGDYIDADPFIIKWMGVILKDDEFYYNGLKRTSDEIDLKKYGLNRHCYKWFSSFGGVNQFMMSSGEFLVLGLLSYIKERIDEIKKNKKGSKTLIILDEADMALHPSAQERLMDFLYDICSVSDDGHDICIYISTHSTSILIKEKKENIILFDGLNGNIEVISDCYSGYAMRDVSNGVFFDYLIFVEDKLAKIYVEYVIKKNFSEKNALFQVIYVGGYKEVLNFHAQATMLRLGGACKIMSILDGDVTVDANNYIKNNSFLNNKNIKRTFLPIKSMEKFLYDVLITSPNRSIKSSIENVFFKTKGFRQVLPEYQRKVKGLDDKELLKGKFLWNHLVQEVISQNGNEHAFTEYICEISINHITNDKMERELTNFLDS